MDTLGGVRPSVHTGGRGVSRESVHVVYEQNNLKNFGNETKFGGNFYKIKQNLLHLNKKRIFFQKFKVQNLDFPLKSPLYPFPRYTATNWNVDKLRGQLRGGGGLADCPHRGGEGKNSQKSFHMVYERPLT